MPMGPLDDIVVYTSRSLRGPIGMVLATQKIIQK
jgi:hypothetical protein